MTLISDKINAQLLVSLLWQKGIKRVVLSPGSRNAPLINSFHHHPEFICHNAVDERSAGFIALGMAQTLAQPVVLCCTSGSALANYGPAICEAWYRRVPLIVVSADRPPSRIDQGDGQAMHQPGLLSNHISAETNLGDKIHDDEDRWYATAQLNQVINKAFSASAPVHINLSFNEPLYQMVERSTVAEARNVVEPALVTSLPQPQLQELAEAWQQARKRVILVGQQPPCRQTAEWLATINQHDAAVVLSEATSNQSGTLACSVEDFFAANNFDREQLDLLITCGGHVISKSLKKWLHGRCKQHWHVTSTSQELDSYNCLTRLIPMDFNHLMAQLGPTLQLSTSPLAQPWYQASKVIAMRQQAWFEQAGFCDLTVMHQLGNYLPDNTCIHLGNSTPVRFAQYCNWAYQHECHANRGVSGIDGCVSTALGAALADPGRGHLLVVGDLSFNYDSNALMGNNLPDNLRVLLINNGGGQIFSLIPGPGDSDGFSEHFETRQSTRFDKLTAAHNIGYLQASNQSQLEASLATLFNPEQGKTVLEVVTEPLSCADNFKRYKKAICAL